MTEQVKSEWASQEYYNKLQEKPPGVDEKHWVFVTSHLRLPHPLRDSNKAYLTPSQHKAVQFRQHWASKIRAQREQVLKLWHFMLIRLESNRVAWRNSLEPAVRHIIGDFHMPLLEWFITYYNIADVYFPTDASEGLRLFASLPNSAFWPPRSKGPKLPTQDRAQVLAAAKKARQAGKLKLDTKHEQALWDLTGQEAQKHWLEGPYSEAQVDDRFPAGWAPHLIFGHPEAGKEHGIREITDYTGSSKEGANSLFGSSSKVRMPGSPGFIHLAQTASEIFHGDVQFATEDEAHAFKQWARHPDDRQVGVRHLRNPHTGQIVYFIVNVIDFGPRGAPEQYCRASRVKVEILNLALGLLIDHHVDDYFMFESSAEIEHGRSCLATLCRLLGTPLKPQKSKSGSAGIALGIHWDAADKTLWSQGTAFSAVLPMDKREKYILALSNAIEEKNMSPGVASKIAGQIGHVSYAVWQQNGRAFLGPLYARAHGQDNAQPWSPALNFACLNLIESLRDSFPRRVPRVNYHRRRAWLYSDARGRANPLTSSSDELEATWGKEYIGMWMILEGEAVPY